MNDTSGIELLGGGLVFVGLLLAAIFYLLTLQRALERCSPESRAMQPGMVWLMLIPLFNLVWQFFVVSRIARSLEAELRKRSMQVVPQPGKGVGLAMCILSIGGIIPLLGALLGLAAFVCWIIYWVKIADVSRSLAEPATSPA